MVKYDKSNGLWYVLHGDYDFPGLTLPEIENKPIGLWGQRRRSTGRSSTRSC